MTITTKDGTEIYYKDWGNGQPVVFSHGWPLSADAWEDQMVFLGFRGYRCNLPRPAARHVLDTQGPDQHGSARVLQGIAELLLRDALRVLIRTLYDQAGRHVNTVYGGLTPRCV